jgi:hypothetical protein
MSSTPSSEMRSDSGFSKRPVAGEDDPCPRQVVTEQHRRPNQVLEALLLRESSGRQDRERVPNPELCAHLGRRSSGLCPLGRHAVGDCDDLACLADTLAKRPVALEVAHGDDPVAPAGRETLGKHVRRFGRSPGLLVEREEVDGVHDRRDTRPTRGERAHDSRLRRMRVHDRIGRPRKERRESQQTTEVPDRANLPPDHVQIDQAEPLLRDQVPEVGIGCEDIYLEAVLGRGASELEHEHAVAPERSRALDQQQFRRRQARPPTRRFLFPLIPLWRARAHCGRALCRWLTCLLPCAAIPRNPDRSVRRESDRRKSIRSVRPLNLLPTSSVPRARGRPLGQVDRQHVVSTEPERTAVEGERRRERS